MKVLIILLLSLSTSLFAAEAQVNFINAENTVEEILAGQSEDNLKVALSCVCRGGPGNYQYNCAPVATTCHGGPGNYPYTCYVCP